LKLYSDKFQEDGQKPLYLTRISAFGFDKINVNMRKRLDSLGGEQDSQISRNKTNRFSFLSELFTSEKLGVSLKRILIVDDEPAITSTFKIALKNYGFEEVDVYNDPFLALQNFKSGVYALIILDVAMPKIDGFKLYQ
jgi:PleD family two-component response regulator